MTSASTRTTRPGSAVTTPEPRPEPPLPAGAIPSTLVDLPVGTLVITDLHLAPLGDERTERFVRLCDGLEGVPALVCLGDLFDMWVCRRQARMEGSRPVLEALERLARRGVAVHLVPGNRDALLGAWFDRRTGGRLHPDGFVGLLPGGARAVLVHGDALCTRDRGYLRLRSLWRLAPVRLVSWLAPMWFARRVGARLRGLSESVKPTKLPEEKAIQRAAVLEVAAATGAAALVCGHAHDARDQALAGADGAEVRWLVVGAWGWASDLLRVGPDGLEVGSWDTIPAG